MKYNKSKIDKKALVKAILLALVIMFFYILGIELIALFINTFVGKCVLGALFLLLIFAALVYEIYNDFKKK